MRRFVIAALILAMGASFNVADAAKKKKKEKVSRDTAAVVLNSVSDSLSYAAGMAQTEGLIPFLKQQHGVDTAYLADFIRGYQDAISQNMDDRFKAYNTGIQIAMMVDQRMIPSMRESLKGIPDTVSTSLFNSGFIAALKEDTCLMTKSKASTYFRDMMSSAVSKRNEAARKAGEEFLRENKTKEGVHVTESGLQYKVLVKGTGEIPSATDEVTVKYEGRLTDGTVFDSSYKRNPQTSKFHANQVIKGWTEALTMMPVGSKWELYIPQSLAYGDRQAGNIPPFSTLIFTVELVGINK